MIEEFSEVLEKLSGEDRDKLACAHVLGVHPLSIMKVEWKEHEGYPEPHVTVRLGNGIKSTWREGRFPWTSENLPTEKTRQIEEFLQSVKERQFFSRY